MPNGLSEQEIDRLVVACNAEKKFLEIHRTLFGQTPPNSKGIAKALRKRLRRSQVMDNEYARKVFGPTESIRLCFVYEKIAIAVCSGTVVDVAHLRAPEIDLSKVRFSAHALEQFKKRYKEHCQVDLSDSEQHALRFLGQATEQDAISDIGKVKRIIDNEFEEARYFIFEKWRFVIIEKDDLFLVKTIEYAYLC